eukprot:TRINITY_DN10859_c0_g1_i1.p1 TRINITY_DN10859_c0_g1~~TRINITY_DN10859_c0_g1_i1.p1  ORF type:complete len:305 (+),score=21.47 TRINITY_DN10859_c0_g1_i1:151-1065(+)
MPHKWVRKHVPRHCRVCRKWIVNPVADGMKCTKCGLISHRQCTATADTTPSLSICRDGATSTASPVTESRTDFRQTSRPRGTGLALQSPEGGYSPVVRPGSSAPVSAGCPPSPLPGSESMPTLPMALAVSSSGSPAGRARSPGVPSFGSRGASGSNTSGTRAPSTPRSVRRAVAAAPGKRFTFAAPIEDPAALPAEDVVVRYRVSHAPSDEIVVYIGAAPDSPVAVLLYASNPLPNLTFRVSSGDGAVRLESPITRPTPGATSWGYQTLCTRAFLVAVAALGPAHRHGPERQCRVAVVSVEASE